MTWIRTLEKEEAEGYIESVYEHYIKNRGGIIANIVKVHSLNENAFQSFMQFSKLLFFPSALSRKTKEMINVTVSVENECHY